MIGVGGFAREVHTWLFKSGAHYQLIGHFDEDPNAKPIGNFPIFRSFDDLRYANFIVAVGDPVQRKILFEMAVHHGLVPALPIVSHLAFVGEGNMLGRGSIICPGACITTNIHLGHGTILNLNSTVGHDAILGDFVTCSPGVNISGNAKIGDGVYLGTNCAIREQITIGDWSVIGMGTPVVKDLPPNSKLVGAAPRNLAAVRELG